MSSDRRGSRLWRAAVSAFTSSQSALDAADLQADVRSTGTVPIGECAERQYVAVCGSVQSITLQPRAGIPALEAELYDGSGALTIVWLGRRRIGGIDPGRRLIARGRIAIRDGRKVMYNPAYELRPA